MSEGTQAIFFFLAFCFFLVAAFAPYYGTRVLPHFGWFGATLIAFVLTVVAFKAS